MLLSGLAMQQKVNIWHLEKEHLLRTHIFANVEALGIFNQIEEPFVDFARWYERCVDFISVIIRNKFSIKIVIPF